MMDTSVSFIGLFLIVGSINILKADVTLIGGNINTNNTDNLNYAIVIAFDQGDIDRIEMEWDPPKSPQFDYYFNVDVVLDDSKAYFTAKIEWNGDRTHEERKLANRQFVTKAILGSTIVKNLTRTMTFQWLPNATSLTLYHIGDQILRGSILNLTCECPDEGYPAGNIVWKVNGTQMTGNMYNDDVINFDMVQPAQDGTWECYYKNDVGAGMSDSEPVEVQWPPTSAHISTSSRTAKRGEKLKLTCSSPDGGKPNGTVVWTKGTSDVSGYSGEVYTINSTTESDDGLWKCAFRNTHGTSPVASVNIDVIWPASNVSLTLNDTGPFNKTESLVMICRFSEKGDPTPILTFKVNNIVLNDLEPINSSTYRLNSIADNHNGSLKCCYNNTAGEACSDTHDLLVYRAVSMDAKISRDLPAKDVRVGDDITFECNVTDKGIPQAEVIWTHNDTVQIGENNYTFSIEDVQFRDSGEWGCSANNSFSRSNIATYTLKVEPSQEMSQWMYIVIGVCCGILLIVIIVIIVIVVKKNKRKDKESDSIEYANRSLQPDNKTGTGPANKPNIEAAAPVYAAVSRGKVLAPIAAGADGSVYSQVDLSKKTARQSLKGLPMSKKAIDRIIFHKKDGYVNMTFQVRKKFIGDIEIGVCRIGDQSCTSKVSKQHDGASKDVVMVLPIEDPSPDSYSIRIKFTERGQVTQTVDLTYPYNKNAVNVTVLNDAHGTNVSPSYADVEVEGVPSRPPRQGYPAEGVTYAVMDWDRSQAPGRPPRLSARSQAQEHVVYADVRPGGNVY